MNMNNNDFKICPQCGTKFTKEEWFKKWKEESNITSIGRLESLWKKKRFCKYDCSTKFHAKSAQEKRLTEIKQHQLKGTLPYEIWSVEDGRVKEIKLKILGKDLVCSIKDGNKYE